MQLTVIIPTYNEAENLPELVSALFSLPVEGLNILIVDDNSPDGTGNLALSLSGSYPGRLNVLQQPGKLGLGNAYLSGFRWALAHDAQAIAQMDADFSHPPEKLPEMLNALRDWDVVMGSRYVSGGSVDRRWPFWRQGLSLFGNFYARTILQIPFRDCTGGFRLWRRETLLGMPLARALSNGYAFQIEIAYVAYRLGYRSCEIPIHFADRRWGKSKMSFRIQLEAAIRVWQLLYQYRDLRS